MDTIEALNPRAVVAGHKRAENDHSPRIIEETRRYMRDFERVAAITMTARELFDKMLELYPGRLNGGALWSSARGAKRIIIGHSRSDVVRNTWRLCLRPDGVDLAFHY